MDAKNKQKMAFSGKGRPLLPKMWKMTDAEWTVKKRNWIKYTKYGVQIEEIC